MSYLFPLIDPDGLAGLSHLFDPFYAVVLFRFFDPSTFYGPDRFVSLAREDRRRIIVSLYLTAFPLCQKKHIQFSNQPYQDPLLFN